jgi:hypothetical protein
MHGIGVHVWPDGDVYCGEFCGGKRQGYGVYYYPNGAVYRGEWRENKREGFGVEDGVEGPGTVYRGQWEGDQRQGHGVFMLAANGEVYRGQWEEDQRQGHGVWTVKIEVEGGQILQRDHYGNFFEDRRHGRGVLFWDWGKRTYVKHERGKQRKSKSVKFDDTNSEHMAVLRQAKTSEEEAQLAAVRVVPHAQWIVGITGAARLFRQWRMRNGVKQTLPRQTLRFHSSSVVPVTNRLRTPPVRARAYKR